MLVADSDEPISFATDITFSPSSVKELSSTNSLCLTGPALAAMEAYCTATDHDFLQILKCVCPHIRLFARVSPTQKEGILIGE